MTKEPYRKNWFVIIAVVITGMLKFILADWLDLRVFYITAACLFWLVFILIKYKKDHRILKNWGFQKHNLKPSLLFLLPFVLTGLAGIIIYGILFNASFLNWHILPVFALYPAWGLIQQFIVAGLVAGNLKTIAAGKLSDLQIILIISLLFAIVHSPSIPLMAYTFVMEFIFLHAYFKYKNLWPLGLYHGWISGLFIFLVLKRDLWNELLGVFH